MNSQSRMAARDSFAHQRALLFFSPNPSAKHANETNRFAPPSAAVSSARKDIVRNGLIGFVPVGTLQ